MQMAANVPKILNVTPAFVAMVFVLHVQQMPTAPMAAVFKISVYRAVFVEMTDWILAKNVNSLVTSLIHDVCSAHYQARLRAPYAATH
jgi:hypothetical protein